MMSFEIGFLFLVAADLELICWLKVETFLNDLTYGKPSSRVVPAYPQLFCTSAVNKLYGCFTRSNYGYFLKYPN